MPPPCRPQAGRRPSKWAAHSMTHLERPSQAGLYMLIGLTRPGLFVVICGGIYMQILSTCWVNYHVPSPPPRSPLPARPPSLAPRKGLFPFISSCLCLLRPSVALFPSCPCRPDPSSSAAVTLHSNLCGQGWGTGWATGWILHAMHHRMCRGVRLTLRWALNTIF